MPRLLPSEFEEYTRKYIYIGVYAVFPRVAKITSNLYMKTQMSEVSTFNNLMTFTSRIDCRHQIPSHIWVKDWYFISLQRTTGFLEFVCRIFRGPKSTKQEVETVNIKSDTWTTITIHLPSRWLVAQLIFDPEVGGDMFLRNVGWHSTDYTVLYPGTTAMRTWNATYINIYFLSRNLWLLHKEARVQQQHRDLSWIH
jgi:hypothetical protein